MADDKDKRRRAADDEEDEFGIDQKRMPFTEHLVELRYRILVCLVTVGVAFLVFFLGFRIKLYNLLSRPVHVAGEQVAKALAESTGREIEVRFFSMKPYSMFATSAYICLLAAVALTIPVTLYEMWMFVAPGLKRRERGAVRPILLFGSFFFLAGAAFAYTQVVPAAMRFLLQDTAQFEGLELRFDVASTLKFETTLLLVFGLAFELPVVIVTLTRLGILTPEGVAKRRRMAILVMFVGAAVLTPPDVITQLLLAGPLVVLLEISIQASKFFRPKKTIWDQWEDAGTGDAWDEALGEWDQALESGDDRPGPTTTGETPPQAGEEPPPDYGEHYDDEYYGEGQYDYETREEEPPAEEPGEEEPGGKPEPDERAEGEPGDAGRPGEPPDSPGPPDDELPPDARMH